MHFLCKSSKYGSYTLLHQLRGHTGHIGVLRATEDGRLLASGGSNGTKIWNLRTMREVEAPHSPESRGATTAIVWIKDEDDLQQIVFSGTQKGHLVCWEGSREGAFEERSCIRLVEPAEVACLTHDSPAHRLAVCHHGGVVQLYELKGTALEQLFSIALAGVVPKSVQFGHIHNNVRDLLVFSLYSGDVITLRGNTGTLGGSPWNAGTLIGDAVVDIENGVLCLDDPSSGACLFRLNDHARIKTFSVKITKKKRVRQVAFASQCTSIVSGSDHGVVYVFDRQTGQAEELRVDRKEWVQTVATCKAESGHWVFAARSRELEGPNHIAVWRKGSARGCGCGAGTCVCFVIAFQVVFMAVLVLVMMQKFPGPFLDVPAPFVDVLAPSVQ